MIRIKLQEIYDIAVDMDLLIHHVFCQGAGLSDKNSVARGLRKTTAACDSLASRVPVFYFRLVAPDCYIV